MALQQSSSLLSKSSPVFVPTSETRILPVVSSFSLKSCISSSSSNGLRICVDREQQQQLGRSGLRLRSSSSPFVFLALDKSSSSSSSSINNPSSGKKNAAASSAVTNSSNYVVPLDKSSSCITRPLAEILRDLNKRVPDKIIQPDTTYIPWYHANRMLSFYAPGWCGEIRDVMFSENGSVTVVYRVTIRGSDGEAHRESTGTVSSSDSGGTENPVAAAEEMAFCRACARFGLGLYLYHEDETL